MAYVGNQLSCITQTIEGNFNEYIYINTVDALATVLGANYISDGQKRGMELGNIVYFYNGTTTVALQVTALQALASGYGVTLSPVVTGYGTGTPTKYTTGALTAATLTAAQIAGADFTVLNNTGNTPGTQTLPAAAVLFAAMPNAQVGSSYILRLLNGGTGTETLAADSGATITVTGHTAILTLTWVDWLVTFTSATTATFQSIGSGDAP